MGTPNLAIAHIAAGQNQKEVTANDAFDALDDSTNRRLTLALADADLTLAASQANRYGFLLLTGTLTAPRTLTLPANHRRLVVRNATTGGHAITLRYPGAGAAVALVPESTFLVQGDGLDLYAIGGTGGGAEDLADLGDVDLAGALNGDLLRFDGGLWRPDAGGVHARLPLPYKGALLQRSTSLTGIAFPLLVPFESAVYDTGGFWSAASPTRLTVPAGVTKVRLQGSVALKANATGGGVYVSFHKDGIGEVTGGGVFTVRQATSGYTNNDYAAISAVLPVTAGDWFELRVNATTSTWNDLQASPRTWFALEVVETTDAAAPPAEITLFKPGQPATGELLLRLPIARRLRLEASLAGSQASAGTAPTGQADLDLRRNGTSIGTIRFAAGAATASFIAASATTLEPGDVLTVLAPSPADATLAGIGVAIAATRLG